MARRSRSGKRRRGGTREQPIELVEPTDPLDRATLALIEANHAILRAIEAAQRDPQQPSLREVIRRLTASVVDLSQEVRALRASHAKHR